MKIRSFLTATLTTILTLILTLIAETALAATVDPGQYTFAQRSYAVKHSKGFNNDQKNNDFLKRASYKSYVGIGTAVPGNYSMRGKAGPVENQGQCGSCWDFSLTTVLRGTLIMSAKDPGRLSFNYLLNCDRTMDGCNGGDFSAADMFVPPTYPGAPAYGSDGQYTGVQGSCIQEPAVASATAYNMLGTSGANPSFEDIAYVVGVLHRPVTVDVAVDSQNVWESYSGGIYNACDAESSSLINHMVSIEGYSCETSVDSNGNCTFDSSGNLPAGVGYWVVRNSWGTSWGDNGYITTKATDSSGLKCNSIATDALYFDVTGAPPTPGPSPNPSQSPGPNPTPPPPPPPPSGNIAASPTLDGAISYTVTNPYLPIVFAYNVSNFSGAANAYFEGVANRNFSQPNGITPDAGRFVGQILRGPSGAFQFSPMQFPVGTYFFRIIPLDATGSHAVGLFSNPSMLIVP